MNKLIVSECFDVDDIRKIREYNSLRHINMTPAEILSLQDKTKCLEKENQYLKSLLDQAGISYHASDEMKNRDLFDPDQGKRIIPREITDHDANLFFSMFWGCTDVYAKRTLKKSTGEINYYTQCYNFFKTGFPRMSSSKIRCQDCNAALISGYFFIRKQRLLWQENLEIHC